MVRVLRVERQVRFAVVEVVGDHALADLAVVGGATPNRATGLDVPHAGIAGGVDSVALKTLRRDQRDCRATGHRGNTHHDEYDHAYKNPNRRLLHRLLPVPCLAAPR